MLEQDDREDLAVHDAALEQLHRRQPQALLLDLGGVGREAARHHAADVGPVAGVLQPAEQLAVVVERQGEAHVHQVRAAEIGIVDDVDVAGLAAAATSPSPIRRISSARRILHGADEHRQAELALAMSAPVVGGRRCRTERSSASAMTGEKAEREKAMSISLQTCRRPAWITARVSGSRPRLPLGEGWRTLRRRCDRDPRLPMASTARRRPGLDHGGGVDLLDDRRALDQRVGRAACTRSKTVRRLPAPVARRAGARPMTASSSLRGALAGIDQAWRSGRAGACRSPR